MSNRICKFRPGSYLAAAAAFAMVAGAAGMAAAHEAKPKGPPPTPVVVALVREVLESPKLTFNGFLEPDKKAIVSAVEAGFVKAILKRDGETVEHGTVLAVLSNPSLLLDLQVLQAQIAESEAILNQARLSLDRMKSLFDKKLVAAEQYENERAGAMVIEARLTTSQATANRLRRKLKMLVIRSPIQGQIVSIDLEIGQWITPNKEIFEISNFESFVLRVGIPAKFINTVQRGARVEINVPELQQRLTGKIHAIIHHVESSTGNFSVRIRLGNPNKLPLSGLMAEATVPIGPRKKVKIVPRDAIVRRGQTTQIVVVRDNTAQIVLVKVQGNLDGAVIIAASGLKAKESVVVRGNERLFPGTPVKVTELK